MAIEIFATNVDFKQNQLLNLVVHTELKFPSSPKEGQLFYLPKNYYNYEGKKLYYYNGSQWIPWGSGSSSGSVTSVGINTTDSTVFSITNSPITNSGNIDISLKSQLPNYFLASPLNSSGSPIFRAIGLEDLPDLSTYYIRNSLVEQLDSKFNVSYGIFNEYVEILNNTPSNTSNKLYNIAGVLYWNGNSVISSVNTFLNIADYEGIVKFSANGNSDSLRFEAGNGLIVAFNAVSKKITYSLDTLPASTVKETYYFEFSLPETISNTDEYLYSWSKSSNMFNSLRSGSETGFLNTITPIISPFSGVVKRAILKIFGAGIQSLNIVYPCYLQTEIIKQNNGDSTILGVVDFTIPNTYSVGLYAPDQINAFIEKNLLNISISKGDALSLKFKSSKTTYGVDSTISHIKNIDITLIMEEN